MAKWRPPKPPRLASSRIDSSAIDARLQMYPTVFVVPTRRTRQPHYIGLESPPTAVYLFPTSFWNAWEAGVHNLTASLGWIQTSNVDASWEKRSSIIRWINSQPPGILWTVVPRGSLETDLLSTTQPSFFFSTLHSWKTSSVIAVDILKTHFDDKVTATHVLYTVLANLRLWDQHGTTTSALQRNVCADASVMHLWRHQQGCRLGDSLLNQLSRHITSKIYDKTSNCVEKQERIKSTALFEDMNIEPVLQVNELDIRLVFGAAYVISTELPLVLEKTIG